MNQSHWTSLQEFAFAIVLALALALAPPGISPAIGAEIDSRTTGPAKGTLVIAGGGSKQFIPIFGKFVELAGGKDAPIVIVPTASSSKPDYDYFNHRNVAVVRKRFGLTNITVLHTHDRKEADTPRFVKVLENARGLWFTGGRQWRLADAYLGTLSERKFHEILERGGVVGGSSAGASIQGSFLVRGDTRGSGILIGDHQHGFGFLANSAIDQHLIARGRQLALVEILTDPASKMDDSIDRAALLGIGIDEDAAIVVRQNRLEVIGKRDGKVLIYDPRRWTSGLAPHEKYLALPFGSVFDLATRRVIEPAP